MDELKEVLAKLQKAFNAMVDQVTEQGTAIAEIKKSLGDKVTMTKAIDTIEDEIAEIEKAGRKIAGSTMSRLKTLQSTLSAIISEAGGSETDDNDKKKVDKSTPGSMADFMKGLKGEETGDDKDTPLDKKTIAGIAAVVEAVLNKKTDDGEKPDPDNDSKK